MANLHISLAAEPVFSVGSLPITNSMITGIVGSALVALALIIGARLVVTNPNNRLAQGIEAIIDLFLGLIEQVMGSRAKAVRFLPIIVTLFLFILVNNWLGLVPGVGSIVVHSDHGTVPLFRGATADLNMTLALAIISVVMTHAYAIRELGLFSHLKKYVSWNPVMLFVGFLEFISEFSKMISFSFRLFGNIFAGEVLLVVISFLAPLLGPLPFYGLELFVGLVQALVFTMLTLVFLHIATSHHDDHESHDAKEGSDSIKSHQGTVSVETA